VGGIWEWNGHWVHAGYQGRDIEPYESHGRIDNRRKVCEEKLYHTTLDHTEAKNAAQFLTLLNQSKGLFSLNLDKRYTLRRKLMVERKAL